MQHFHYFHYLKLSAHLKAIVVCESNGHSVVCFVSNKRQPVVYKKLDATEDPPVLSVVWQSISLQNALLLIQTANNNALMQTFCLYNKMDIVPVLNWNAVNQKLYERECLAVNRYPWSVWLAFPLHIVFVYIPRTQRPCSVQLALQTLQIQYSNVWHVGLSLVIHNKLRIVANHHYIITWVLKYQFFFRQFYISRKNASNLWHLCWRLCSWQSVKVYKGQHDMWISS